MRPLLIILFAAIQLSATANAALTSQGCVESDLLFLDEIIARASAGDETLFDDARRWGSASLSLYKAETLAQFDSSKDNVDHLRRISSYSTCDELRQADTYYYLINLDYKRAVRGMIFLSDKSRKIFPTMYPDWLPLPSVKYATKNSSSSLKKKGLAELTLRAIDFRESILYNLRNIPHSKGWPRVDTAPED